MASRHRKVIREFDPEVDALNCVCECGLYLVVRQNAPKANCRRPECGVGVTRQEALKQVDDPVDAIDWYCYNCGDCNNIDNGSLCSGCHYPQSYSEEYDSDEDDEVASRNAHAANRHSDDEDDEHDAKESKNDSEEKSTPKNKTNQVKSNKKEVAPTLSEKDIQKMTVVQLKAEITNRGAKVASKALKVCS